MMDREIREIVNFFLNIYKLQSNRAGSFGTVTPLHSEDPDSESTFELKVHNNEQKMTRRMSISLLGKESGSKSKCFKVIYDDIIVVKIPPSPITNFTQYLAGIGLEREIADRLGEDIECVPPRVSAILKHVPPFSKEGITEPEKMEMKCLEKLNIFPELQKFLKIGKSFAFFMNISTHSFLGSVIHDMHNITKDVEKEIFSQVDILGNLMAFENNYGKNNSSVFFRMENLYNVYEEKLAALISGHSRFLAPAYEKKEWFLIHLAKKKVNATDKYPHKFIEHLNDLLENLMEENSTIVKKYRKIIRAIVRKRMFKQNRAQMGGIVSNLIELLANLRKNKIAMRDLKPDNVFVVEKSRNIPLFLASPEEYSIGLIDFETAAVLEKDENNKIKQPMLAGTPSYATPSHLFTNDVLDEIYDDISRILHLQDWQAVNNMIYNVITGKRLSQETGKLMPGLIKIIKSSVQKNVPKAELFENSSIIFWQNAYKEFNLKLKSKRNILKSIKVKLQDRGQKMFLEEAACLIDHIKSQIEDEVLSQKIFRTSKSQKGLIKASLKTIKTYRKNWEKERNVPAMPSSMRNKIIIFLRKLENLKADLRFVKSMKKKLKNPEAVISAHDIIKLMFQVIISAMFKPQWGDIMEHLAPSQKVVADKRDYESTITYEKTVELEHTITEVLKTP